MNALRLPKTCLLRNSKQYNQVYRFGKRIKRDGFTLIFLANNLTEDRLGISVSGVRLAVRRNRLKRIIKEFYRYNRKFPSTVASSSGIDTAVDMVISTRKNFSPKTLAELSSILAELTNKKP